MKNIKRICKLMIIVFLSFVLIKEVSSNALESKKTNNFDMTSIVDPTTNFFTQKENKEKVEETYLDQKIIDMGYKLISSNDYLNLYLDEKTLGIALYDTQANYVWYSNYPKYEENKYTDIVKQNILSGVIIECFDSVTLNELTKYSSNPKDTTITYEYLKDGFIAHLKFVTVGISFDVKVTIENSKLKAVVMLDTLEEVPYKTAAMKVAKNYKLKSVTLFPYFGSNNYEINAYAFIPDGSGALIRYTDTSYDTAFIKRVYGDDLGIQKENVKDYLKEQNNITLPIYGINHGFEQAAVLVEARQGYGSCELHSYPYMYSNLNLNRTFFKFLMREKTNIELSSSSSGTITLINSDVYQKTYALEYSFLNGENASYVGMAKKYKESLDLKKQTSKVALKLDCLAQDYKLGLFGKNFIEFTSYKQALSILKELKNENLNLDFNYIGYNSGGYYDNMQFKMKLDSDLGSKADFKKLNEYAKENNINIYYYSNPLVTNVNSLGKKTIKKHNLEVFNYTFKSSLEQTGKVINPSYLASYFLKNKKKYQNLSMTNFSFDYLGQASFSYRYNGKSVVREEMIACLEEQLTKFSDYNIALSKPNSYLYKYLNAYFDCNYESSKYAFITDSIPFISLVLSGNVQMYGPNINYVSNALLYNLRLIEYNLNPSFMITFEDSDLLRYTNSEYLYTTKYEVWKSQIIETFNFISDAMEKTNNQEMINHRYIDSGVVEITYKNGYKIYINYTSSDYIINGKTIKSMSYIGGIE